MTDAAFQELHPLIERLYAELRSSEIAAIYCDYGGEDFWRSRREAVRGQGILWAEALASRLQPEGRSLYVGAGIAELPAMLVETRGLKRKLSVANLRERECVELNRALRAVGVSEAELLLEPRDAIKFAAAGPFDHLCMVSVLNDPELYPQVSGLSYGRIPPVLMDLEAFAAEREQLHALLDAVLGSLTVPALVTTSYEEVPWILFWAERAGLRVESDDTSIETAVVGDPIGFLRLQH